jgi:hypothetical protein
MTCPPRCAGPNGNAENRCRQGQRSGGEDVCRIPGQPGHGPPQPLHDPDGRLFLASALDEIDARYGSVEGYLEKVAGVTAADIAMLRKAYTE